MKHNKIITYFFTNFGMVFGGDVEISTKVGHLQIILV
jgi:hypothetical protein